MRYTARWLTWLCLSLMLWTAVAESTHSHLNKTESASCSICMVAHSSSPAASANYARPLFAAVGVLHEEEITANAQINISDFGIRGPPAL